VGKTYVSQGLAQILPDAVYAKIGHGTPKPGRPAAFFGTVEAFRIWKSSVANETRHYVVESNQLAARDEGDICVYIEAPTGFKDVRPDARSMAEHADILIGAEAHSADWRAALSAQFGHAPWIEAVTDLFEEQRAFVARRGTESPTEDRRMR